MIKNDTKQTLSFIHYKFIMFFIMLFIIFIPSVHALNLNIEEVTIEEKSSTITVGTPSYTDNEINNSITFNQINDYVIYNIKIKNNDEESYKIESIVDNNTNENIEITYEKDETISSNEVANIKLRLTYKTQLYNIEEIDVSDLNIIINLKKQDNTTSTLEINPVTGDNIEFYFIAIIILLLGILFLLKKKKIGSVFVLSSIIFIPLIAFATNGLKFTINFTNLKVKGEYRVYNISINDNENISTVERTHGLPLNIEGTGKTGYSFVNWKDENNNIVTKDTIITGELSLTAQYSPNEYTVIYDSNGGTGEISNQLMTYDTSSNLTKNIFTKTDKIFTNWNTNSSGTGESYSDEELVLNLVPSGTITLYAMYRDPVTATFIDGSTINKKMKVLAGNQSATKDTIDNSITEFRKVTSLPSQYESDDYIVSTTDSATPIYLWYDNGIIKYYSTADRIYFNSRSDNFFKNLKALTNADVNLYTDKVTNMDNMFVGDTLLEELIITNWNTVKVKSMSSIFSGLETIQTLNLSNFNTSNVENMYAMFKDCKALTNVNINSFVTTKVTNMASMFRNTKISTLNLSHFDTANVTNMEYMFSGMKELTTLNISSFNTEKVTTFDSMFSGVNKIETLDVSNFKGTRAQNINNMFSGMTNVKILDLSNFNTTTSLIKMLKTFSGTTNLKSITFSTEFNTSSVANMEALFEGSGIEFLDLSSFNTSSVTTMKNMFNNCKLLETIIASNNFVTTSVTTDSNMFNNALVLQGSQGTTYDSNHKNKNYAHIDGGTTNPGYFSYSGNKIKFNYNEGATTEKSRFIATNNSIGELPLATREGANLIGWFTSLTGGEQITADYVPTSNMTLYAHWDIYDYFPTVFTLSSCTFNGINGTVTNCSDYSSIKFITTNIKLFNEDNYKKDFEIYFEIEEYNPNNQDGDQTIFVNSKLEDQSKGYPGFVFRRDRNTNNLEITETIEGNRVNKSVSYSSVQKVKIVRKNNKLYYSFNNANLTELQDISNFAHPFDTPVTFGGAYDATNTQFRVLHGTIKNIYIKMGHIEH